MGFRLCSHRRSRGFRFDGVTETGGWVPEKSASNPVTEKSTTTNKNGPIGSEISLNWKMFECDDKGNFRVFLFFLSLSGFRLFRLHSVLWSTKISPSSGKFHWYLSYLRRLLFQTNWKYVHIQALNELWTLKWFHLSDVISWIFIDKILAFEP